jgi:predicted ATP-grasp superfamily ATP-dependent carboligase
MSSAEHVLIFGASARAAAFSALRAGLRPWCADLFGDVDLQAVCPTWRLAPGTYPRGFVQASAQGPPGPWLYVGGLENRRALVRRLARGRLLWGNDAPVLRIVRSPRALQGLLHAAGLPCPDVRFRAADLSPGERWLVKPWAGAGGTGIRFWNGTALPVRGRRVYFQRLIEGDAWAALFLGDGRQARLLGATRQLTGIDWLHARPFAYCGSLGPLSLTLVQRQALQRLGDVLVSGSGLRGLFGVDCLVNEAGIWPVEVNPRYTASVEVLEHGLGMSALALHRTVFEAAAPQVVAGGKPEADTVSGEAPVLGKAVLFARAPVVFPEGGPWQSTLADLTPWISGARVREPPAFADLPPAGQRIEAGRPVLTFFARGSSAPACLEELKQIAAALDQRLWKT